MDFSIPQQKAIDIRDTNVVVSASAGSGKTAVLVERLCQLVLKDHISIDSILAMTFTKDAAAEMKARLLSKLKEQPKTEYILQQMALLETASISTIDSFCLSIVQNYYYKIPISYTMSKQTASSAQTRIAFDNAYKHAIQDLHLAAYTKLKMYFLSFGKTEEDIQKYIEDILAILNSKSEEDAKTWIKNIQDSYTYLSPELMEYALKYFHNHCLAMSEILSLLKTITFIEIFLELGRAVNIVLVRGMQASGDTHYPVYISILSMWGVATLLSYMFGIVLGWGLIGVWLAMALDECLRAIIFYIRWKRGGWRGKAVI